MPAYGKNLNPARRQLLLVAFPPGHCILPGQAPARDASNAAGLRRRYEWSRGQGRPVMATEPIVAAIAVGAGSPRTRCLRGVSRLLGTHETRSPTS